MKFLPLLLAGWCVASRAAGQNDESPPDTAPRSPADVIKSVRMQPVKAAPGAVTTDQMRAKRLPWLKRILLGPMQKKTAAHPQGAAAVQFAADLLAFYDSPGAKSAARAAELLKQGQELIAKGLRDPVVFWLTSRAALLGVPDRSVRKALLEKAQAGLAGAGYSAMLTAYVCGELCNTRALEADQNELLTETAEALIAAKDEPGTFQGDEAQWYIDEVAVVFELSFENSHTELFNKVYHAPQFPEWARETLAGKWEVCLAWKDRGGGWANAVPQKGWEGFAEHLSAARTHLLRAWTLDPSKPYAAYKMMSVAGGGHGGPGDTLRLWFDRTTAAVFDYTDAHKQYLNFTRPRWGGGFAQMAAFGLACAETKRFDTQVPAVLLEALDRIAADAESPEARKLIFSDPAIAPAVSFTCDAYVRQAVTPADRELWQSRQALYGWLAGDHGRAAAALRQVKGRIAPEVKVLMQRMHVDATTMAGECALASAGEMKSMESAIALYEKRSYPAARSAFTALGKKSGGEAQPLLQSWLALVDIEERFLRGETIKLTTDPDLTLWGHSFGQWKAGTDGSLIAAGRDGDGRIFHRARFGDRLEFVADVAFSHPEAQGQGLCLAVCGRRFNTDGFAWNACGVFTAEGDDAIHAGISYNYGSSSAGEVLSPLEDLSKVRLHVRCADKTLSLRVNDWVAFDKVTVTRNNRAATPFLYPADGHIGFAHPNFLSQHTVTVKNMAVRRVP